MKGGGKEMKGGGKGEERMRQEGRGRAKSKHNITPAV